MALTVAITDCVFTGKESKGFGRVCCLEVLPSWMETATIPDLCLWD